MMTMKAAHARVAVGVRFLCVLTAAGLAASLGCSGGGGKLVPVEGKVTYNGQALKGGSIQFVREKQTAGAATISGKIDPDGTYKMTTAGKPGVPLGKYKVTLAPPPPGAGDTDPMNMKKGAPGDAQPVMQFPAKYSDPAATQLTVEVVASPAPGAYDFKLQQ